jgi:predicted nucleic acid-binding protein
MRIVVDTNVFVSAVLKLNSLPFLVVRWIDEHGGLLKSAATEREILSEISRRRPRGARSTSGLRLL